MITPQAFAEYEDTIVILETPKGKLIIEFFPDVAPNHVENFVTLSENGFYEGTMFHRIIEGFMIQGGDPKTKDPTYSMNEWGTGDPGYSIDAEFNQIKHNRGIVSMARSADPNSGGSQFFIVHEDSHFLDGQYTVFGRILTDESFDTLDRIANLTTINSQTGISDQNGDQPINPTQAQITKVSVLDRSELPNLPTSNAPEKTHAPVMETGGGMYTNSELGVSFMTPVGWMIQTPPKVDSTTPDVVVAGPKIGNISPALTLKVTKSSSSLDQDVENFFTTIQPLIDNGVIEISSDSPLNVNDYKGYQILAKAKFENSNNQVLDLGFRTILISENNILYEIQYMNTLDNFDQQDTVMREMLNSFKIINTLSENPDDNITMEEWKEQTNSVDGGGCLIATAAYGSEMAPQVQFLREIRDNKVMTTQSGTAFMTGFNQFYYSFSPAVADYERENPVFKEAVKVTLTPMLTSLTLLNYVDVDSEQEILGYGIGIILLNIGMYFVAPAAAIIAIKNRIKRQ